MAFDHTYPEAELHPWKYKSASGPTFYKGQNKPIAVVIHIMQGHASTAIQWAAEGHYGASWSFTVTKAGEVYQHLNFSDGGYHAGEVKNPTWDLYNGHNPNLYTVGIEHEGFSGKPYPDAQIEASTKLCRWILDTIGQPVDRDHVIGHYEIDAVNRPNDPGPTFPWDRYMELVKGDEGMTPAEIARMEKLEDIVNRIDIQSIILGPDGAGYSILDSLRRNSDAINAHLDAHPSGGVGTNVSGTFVGTISGGN